jgi:Flp pilus assembly protein TadD
MTKFIVGRGEETEAHVQEALRLSPHDTFAYHWMGIVGTAKLFIGNDDEAITQLRRAIELNRNYSIAHLHLAAHWHILTGSMERDPRFRRDLPSLQHSPCVASTPERSATIRSI